MSYTINSDLSIYNDQGQRLPRTEVARLIDTINANFSRPVSVYLMTTYDERILKVGIAEDTVIRKYQNERDFGAQLAILDTTVSMDRKSAGEIERSIHRFLIGLGRGPIFKQEYFKLLSHDVWLIRNILNETPIKAAPHIFDTLTADYVPMIHEYNRAAAYYSEEIRLHFGNSVSYHAAKEVKLLQLETDAA